MNPKSPDDERRQRICTAVEGYLELGLPELAAEELLALPASQQDHPEVMEARLGVMMRNRDWPAAIDTGKEACRRYPEITLFFIHTAYCLHESGRTAEARDLLHSGPPSLDEDSLYHYNMSCYHAVLGDAGSAESYLRRAIAMDGKLRAFARKDPDLKSLHHSL